MHSRRHRLSILLASTLLAPTLLATPASAVLVVDWGGDYVTSTQPFARQPSLVSESSSSTDINGDGDTSDTVYTAALDLSTPISPATGANYSGTSAVFYGGMLGDDLDDGDVTNNTPAVDDFEVFAATPDRIDLLYRRMDTSTVILWQKADLLNGGDTAAVSVDSSSAISITTDRVVTGTYRALIRNGSTFYVSQSAGFASSDDLAINVASELWAEYDIADGDTALFFDSGATFNVLGSTFGDIQAVGYYFETGKASGVAMDLTDFEADFVVPEPASLALLAVGAMMVALPARGRRRGQGGGR